MRCTNSGCGQELPIGTKFCKYCGTKQTALESPTPNIPSSPIQAPILTDGNSLIMRASEQIWHFDEDEGEILPGQRRPLVILDEQSVHLAHTTQVLSPQELAKRTRAILEQQKVPVGIELINACWVRDTQECRPRLVASLRNHPYSDIKMIMGLDYMGEWASLHLLVGSEPEPLPQKPGSTMPLGAWIGFIIGIVILLFAFNGGPQVDFAVAAVAIIYGFIAMSKSSAAAEREWRDKKARQERERSKKFLSRTFKVDDIRLFCTAMRQVFQAVVDDIVKSGGEIMRIEGGKGGFFQGSGSEQPVQAQRVADAAQGEV